MNRHRRRWLALIFIWAIYVAILNPRPDFTRFNCDDSESYLALCDSLAHGRGYTRSLTPDDPVPHKTWPPGVPVLLIPAMAFRDGPVNWHLVKANTVCIGLAGIIFAWLYARRLTGRDDWADLAALGLATNVFYWDFSHQVLGEVPLVTHLLLTLWLTDRVWSGRSVKGSAAFAVGLVAGLGMLIKGHAFGLALVPLAYLFGSRACVDPPRRQLLNWLVFCVGMLIPFFAWMLRNSQVEAVGFDGINQIAMMLYRNPVIPEKGMMSGAETLVAIRLNITQYAIYHIPTLTIPGLWHPDVFDWPRSGFLALSLTIGIIGLSLAKLPRTLPIWLAIAPIGLLNCGYALGGSIRFWVPFGCLLQIAFLVTLASFKFNAGPLRRGPVVVVVLLWLGNLSAYIAWHERHPYNEDGPWRELVELMVEVRESGLQARGVQTPNSQAFQLMTGLRATGNHLNPDHAVVRLDTRATLPTNAIPVVVVRPWAFVKLSESPAK